MVKTNFRTCLGGARRSTSMIMAQALIVIGLAIVNPLAAENWPRWRGPEGGGKSSETGLPLRWSTTKNVVWKVEIPGEGSSSPIVWGKHLFVTSALEDGTRRQVHCLNRDTGIWNWTREITDDNPELTSALTGHAAATPATDGKHVVSFFGNAGLVAYDFQGRQMWHQDFGEFESELGLASSPIIDGDHVIQLCDHDGKFYRTFDSFMICLDVTTGRQIWKTNRRGLERSWSTPIVVPTDDAVAGRRELIVNAQDELRGYSPESGQLLWHASGMTGWVTPSPVYANGLLFATSGKDGPLLAVRPGGQGDVTSSRIEWSHARGGPYVCSPLVDQGRIFVINEFGIINGYRADTGERLFRKRLTGKFTSSPIAAAGYLYVTNESGKTYVLAMADTLQVVAENQLVDGCLASPAVSGQRLFLRTKHHLWCVAESTSNTP